MEYRNDERGGSVIRITKKLKTRILAGGIAALLILTAILTVSLMIKSRDSEISDLSARLAAFEAAEEDRKLAE